MLGLRPVKLFMSASFVFSDHPLGVLAGQPRGNNETTAVIVLTIDRPGRGSAVRAWIRRHHHALVWTFSGDSAAAWKRPLAHCQCFFLGLGSWGWTSEATEAPEFRAKPFNPATPGLSFDKAIATYSVATSSAN